MKAGKTDSVQSLLMVGGKLSPVPICAGVTGHLKEGEEQPGALWCQGSEKLRQLGQCRCS